MKQGFLKVAAVTPPLTPLNTRANVKAITEEIIRCHTKSIQLLLFPELCICGGLRGAERSEESEDGLKRIAAATRGRDIVCFVGLPVRLGGNLYNAVAAVSRGMVLGIILKKHPSAKERGVFSPYLSNSVEEIELSGFIVPVANDLIFTQRELVIAVGAQDTVNLENLSALSVNVLLLPFEAETQPFCDFRSSVFARAVSSRLCAAAVFAFSNGEKCVAECGEILSHVGEREDQTELIADLDIDRLNYRKRYLCPSIAPESGNFISIRLKRDYELLDRTFARRPFALAGLGAADRLLAALSECFFTYSGKKPLALPLYDNMECLFAYTALNLLKERRKIPDDAFCICGDASGALYRMAKQSGCRPASPGLTPTPVSTLSALATEKADFRSPFFQASLTQAMDFLKRFLSAMQPQQRELTLSFLDGIRKKDLSRIELADFFLYHRLYDGWDIAKIKKIAPNAFGGDFSRGGQFELLGEFEDCLQLNLRERQPAIYHRFPEVFF